MQLSTDQHTCTTEQTKVKRSGCTSRQPAPALMHLPPVLPVPRSLSLRENAHIFLDHVPANTIFGRPCSPSENPPGKIHS